MASVAWHVGLRSIRISAAFTCNILLCSSDYASVLTTFEEHGAMIDWPTIVSKNGPRVWQVAWRLLGNDAEAADCYQDTFAAALDVSRRERVGNWSALLRRLSTVHALERLRLRYRQRARTQALAEDSDPPSREPGPAECAQAAELAERLRTALVELPPQEATVFYLRCLEELTYTEIADQLKIEVSSVGAALHRARARLRDLLAGFLTTNNK